MSAINKKSKIDKDKEIKIITDALKKQVMEYNEYPYLYSVCSFGFYDNNGIRLQPSTIRKYWDKTEVHKTCRLLYNMLKEHLQVEQVYCFIERHKPELDKYGDIVKEGRFHINLIATPINDNAVLEPNRRCKRLFYENGRMNVPINQSVYGEDLDDLKIDLVNACCRNANWLNKYSGSVKTQMLYEPQDLSNTIDYCLKDYINKSYDFTDIVVFKASDFYKP